MINPFADIHWNPGTTERHAFGARPLVGIPIIAGLPHPLGKFAVRHMQPHGFSPTRQ